MRDRVKGRVTDTATLRRLVAATGLTLAELAATSGVSYSLIAKAINGRRQLSDRTAHKVAAALRCDPDDFSHRPVVTAIAA